MGLVDCEIPVRWLAVNLGNFWYLKDFPLELARFSRENLSSLLPESQGLAVSILGRGIWRFQHPLCMNSFHLPSFFSMMSILNFVFPIQTCSTWPFPKRNLSFLLAWGEGQLSTCIDLGKRPRNQSSQLSNKCPDLACFPTLLPPIPSVTNAWDWRSLEWKVDF